MIKLLLVFLALALMVKSGCDECQVNKIKDTECTHQPGLYLIVSKLLRISEGKEEAFEKKYKEADENYEANQKKLSEVTKKCKECCDTDKKCKNVEKSKESDEECKVFNISETYKAYLAQTKSFVDGLGADTKEKDFKKAWEKANKLINSRKKKSMKSKSRNLSH